MNETVGTAARLLRNDNVSALVVKDVCRTEGNVVVGMFRSATSCAPSPNTVRAGINLKISALISVQKLVSCQSTDTLEHVRELMNANHIRHLPVIDDYNLIGVISMRDISAVADLAAAAFPEPRTAVPAFA